MTLLAATEMDCRGVDVGVERVWQCFLIGEALRMTTAKSANKLSSCVQQADCCARHPRDPACVASLVERRSREVISRHAEYAEGNAPVRYLSSASAGYSMHLSNGLPHSPGEPRRRWLTFVQGYRQTTEYALQAAMLSLRKTEPLIAHSDLLVHCNNVLLGVPKLLRFLARYPHHTRALIRTPDNSEGYRCGHLQAIASTASVWAPYAAVLFTHPDVYLTPRASRWFEKALLAAMPPSTGDDGSEAGNGGVGDGSEGSASGGGAGDRSGIRPAFLVTEMRWLQENGVLQSRPGGYYGTDLFAFRPPALRAHAWSGVCRVPRNEPVAIPERSLFRLVNNNSTRISEAGVTTTPVRVLGARTTSTPKGEDEYGVWHSHYPADIVSSLEAQRAAASGGQAAVAAAPTAAASARAGAATALPRKPPLKVPPVRPLAKALGKAPAKLKAMVPTKAVQKPGGAPSRSHHGGPTATLERAAPQPLLKGRGHVAAHHLHGRATSTASRGQSAAAAQRAK